MQYISDLHNGSERRRKMQNVNVDLETFSGVAFVPAVWRSNSIASGYSVLLEGLVSGFGHSLVRFDPFLSASCFEFDCPMLVRGQQKKKKKVGMQNGPQVTNAGSVETETKQCQVFQSPSTVPQHTSTLKMREHECHGEA